MTRREMGLCSVEQSANFVVSKADCRVRLGPVKGDAAKQNKAEKAGQDRAKQSE
jgi:hypothetical protein